MPGQRIAEIHDAGRPCVMQLVGIPLEAEGGGHSLFGRTWVFARREWAKRPRWITSRRWDYVDWKG